jgi:hypothetical protein
VSSLSSTVLGLSLRLCLRDGERDIALVVGHHGGAGGQLGDGISGSCACALAKLCACIVLSSG